MTQLDDFIEQAKLQGYKMSVVVSSSNLMMQIAQRLVQHEGGTLDESGAVSFPSGGCINFHLSGQTLVLDPKHLLTAAERAVFEDAESPAEASYIRREEHLCGMCIHSRMCHIAKAVSDSDNVMATITRCGAYFEAPSKSSI